VNPLDPAFFRELKSAWLGLDPAVLLTVISGPAPGRQLLLRQDGHTSGTLGQEWDPMALPLAKQALLDGLSSHCFSLGEAGEAFMEVIPPPPTLIALGGVHIAVPLTLFAKMLGYRTVVIDPRRVWGNAARFSHVDQLVLSWPEEAFSEVGLTSSTAVAVLTHDPKLDDLGLKVALTSSAFYVGALGSRTTQTKRRARLLQQGLSEAQLSRLHAPIGSGIAAQTPEEIALAIMAEVVDAHRRPSLELNSLVEHHQAA
jgi:xanthine dehydrogenase accessory factor